MRGGLANIGLYEAVGGVMSSWRDCSYNVGERLLVKAGAVNDSTGERRRTRDFAQRHVKDQDKETLGVERRSKKRFGMLTNAIWR